MQMAHLFRTKVFLIPWFMPVVVNTRLGVAVDRVRVHKDPRREAVSLKRQHLVLPENNQPLP